MKQVVTSPITASRSWSSMFLGAAWASLSASQDRRLPDGPGKAETRKLCSRRHELGKAFSLSQDQAGWRRTIGKMACFGMKGADFHAPVS
jgi:hypothetical protein